MSRNRLVVLVLAAALAPGCGDPPAAPPGPAVPAPAATSAPSPSPPANPPGHLRMLRTLEEVRLQNPRVNHYLGFAQVESLAADLARLPAGAPAEERWKILIFLGEQEVLHGREREGIAHLKEAHDLLPSIRDRIPAGWGDESVFRLGTSWMRLGETENCCARNSPGSCILPIRGSAIHTVPEGSRNAMACFLEVLGGTERSSVLHRKAVWLLNICAMTLDRHPEDVPEAHRIPPGHFTSAEPFPHFPNVAAKLGLDTFSLSGGAVADDFDGDGDLDLLVSTIDVGSPLRYFRNAGDGTFADRSEEANLAGIFGGLNMVQADYDNDGAVDVLVLRGGWFGKAGVVPNSLLHNDGHGRFTDVTYDAGLAEVNYPTQTASWADMDKDGDLDLYVGNENSTEVRARCQLFRNRNDGTFEDVAASAGVTNDRFTKAVVWGDYDGDGFPDLYVSNNRAENRLYRNEGDGTFTDMAPELGVTGPVDSFPACWWDFDQDGVLDLYVAGYPSDPASATADAAADALGLPFDSELGRLYRGLGNGRFEDVARARGLGHPTSPMGMNFGDLDNDGYPDLYLGTGNTSMWDLIPNRMLHNRGGERFVDVTFAGGFGSLQKGHGVAFADFDRDGDLDVFEELGGAYLGDRYRDALLENPGFGNACLEVLLRGVKTNRSAIGVRIRAEIVDGGKKRSVHATVGSGGSFGANPLRQHLGLGKATRVERLEITWPTTGKVQSFEGIPADRLVEIVEGDDRPRVHPLRPDR